jgi:transcriptional regulator with XRE-family HTH domain
LSIGEKILRIREEKGITRKDLARKLEVTPATITRYEKGDREPKLEQLEKLSQALECDILDFMPLSAQTTFYLNETQLYLNKIMSSKEHPAEIIVDIISNIILQISYILPVELKENKLTEEDKQYAKIIEKLLSAIGDTLDVVGNDFKSDAVFLNSLTELINNQRKDYFLSHYSSKKESE